MAILFLANIYLSLSEEFKAIIAFCCFYCGIDLGRLSALEVLDEGLLVFFTYGEKSSSLSYYESAKSSSLILLPYVFLFFL